MGTWGTGLLDDDNALDFLGELQDATMPERLSRVVDALTRASREGYLEAPTVTEGAVAALVVATALDGQSATGLDLSPLPKPDPKTVGLALRALERLQDERDNEWQELWNEADPGDAEAIRRNIADIAARLQSNAQATGEPWGVALQARRRDTSVGSRLHKFQWPLAVGIAGGLMMLLNRCG